MRAVLLTLNLTLLYVLAVYLLNLFAIREYGNEILFFVIGANVMISLLFSEFEIKKYAPLQVFVALLVAVLTFPLFISLAIPGVVEIVRKS